MFEFFAGGSMIICGNNTENQGGCVFGTETEQGIRAFAKPNGTDTVRIKSEEFGNFDMEIGDCEPRAEEAETFSALVRGIMACFIESGNIFGGFDAEIVSEIPCGSGISVSAAFEVLIGKIISGLFFENSVPEIRLAQFGRTAESDYFGRPCGISERLISAVGGTVLIDFSDPEMPEYRKTDFDFGKSGYTVAVTAEEENRDFPEDYFETEKNLALVAWNMGHNVLSESDEAEFIAQYPILRKKCGEKAVSDALDYYGESRRAREEAEAIENGDFDEFMKIYRESGKTAFSIIPEEEASEFAEEKEKQGFGVMFIF